jgi:hypothetical protein
MLRGSSCSLEHDQAHQASQLIAVANNDGRSGFDTTGTRPLGAGMCMYRDLITMNLSACMHGRCVPKRLLAGA